MKIMRHTHHAIGRRVHHAATATLLLAAALGSAAVAHAQAPFATPEAAAEALIDAVAVSDSSRLPVLLGPSWRQLMQPIEDIPAQYRYDFLAKAHESRKIDRVDGRAHLVVGSDPWTFPVPMARGSDGQWRFDPVAGREEVRVLRIGHNEQAAIQASLAYVDAQYEYASADRNGDGLLEYAQKLLSSPGKRDGLIWSPALGDDSPLGEDYLPPNPGEGYHGYRFRILSAQGPNAHGGARSYLIGKHMVGGFALVAWPVSYGTTGVMTFIVNHDGKVYERDLGPRTSTLANGIKRFDPDEAWKPAQPD